MANFNLTSQQIKDTYEQLVQVSGSALVDGTGSLVNSLDYVTNPTFTSYTSSTATSTSASVADLQTQIDSIEAGSGSADWPLITNKPDGLVSGSSQVDYNGISNVPSGILSSSAQIAGDISGSFTSTSASIAADVATNKTNIATNVSDISTNAGNISTNTGNISTNASNITSLTSQTSSYAKTNVDNSFTGTQTFNDIAVNGTGSFAYLKQITGSAKIIGDEFLILNADTPAARYAGIKVYDSGSGTPATASLEWDGLNDNWILVEESGKSGVLLTGATGSKGGEVLPTKNKLQKGGGHHTLLDSNITDDGTDVTISTPLSASAVKLTSGGLTFADGTTQSTLAQGGLVSGTGTDSMKSADSLTTANADASGQNSIAIGGGTSATATNQIDIGGKFKYDGSDTIRLDSTNLMFNSNGTIGSGRAAINMGIEGGSVSGDYSTIIGATYSDITVGNGFIGGGYNHSITNGTNNAIVGAGENCNITNGDYSAIFGGASNNMSGGDTSFILGGYQNAVTTGQRNGVIGGQGSTSAHNFSVVIGRQSFTSTADYTTYVANLETSGSITLGSEDVVNVSSGSATGSLIDNIHPAIASSSTAIEHIVTLTQNQYTALSQSAVGVDDSTYYIVSDGTSNIWYNDLDVQGNLTVQGQINSPTFAGAIASSTSSIDFDNGNFATLNASSATFLANPTNLKSGTTYTLIVTNGANISGYGTAWKFAGGTEPTLSANTDVITAVSDGSSLYAAALADFS
jgi:hypothetical protein